MLCSEDVGLSVAHNMNYLVVALVAERRLARALPRWSDVVSFLADKRIPSSDFPGLVPLDPSRWACPCVGADMHM